MKIPLLLLFIVVVTTAEQRSARSRNLPTQEEADCPKGCRCDRNNVVCRNKNFNSNVFQQLHPLAFPHLDTIVMTGNTMGDISDNLFGDDEVHPNLSMMNLTDCGITKISEDTFKGTPNIEYLYLSNNKISSSGRNPFSHLRKLRKLELTRALAPRSDKSKADLLSLLFDAKQSGFIDLQEIHLSYNDLEHINPDTFCKIQGLARLFVNGNRLSKFEIAKGCLQSLKMIDLSDNLFNTVSASLWDQLPNLNGVDVHSNPLDCDCKLQPFIEITRRDPNHFYNQGKTTCQEPSSMQGKGVFDLKGDLCKQSNTLLQLLLLLTVAGAVFFLYKRYRDRMPAPPPLQCGYENLHQDAYEERNVRPEFV